MPTFRLLFPAGWDRFGLGEEEERRLLARSRERFRAMHRPDLDLQLTSQIKVMLRRARGVGTFALFLPTGVEEEQLAPISMTASVLQDPSGGTLDGRMTALIRDEGAEFLGEDRAILRWTREIQGGSQLPGAAGLQVVYAVPLPGESRRRALLFATSILDDAAETVGEEIRSMLVGLSDTIVGTFTWVPRAVEERQPRVRG